MVADLPQGAPSNGAPKTGAVLATFLLGILIGGLYLGAVAPVRTVVQADLGVDGATGIWMINIYSLFYAALIPIIGKAADRRGRKRIFVICVGIFAVGSLTCGLAQPLNNFNVLLVGRVMQAAGAGGMIPVANAQIAATFPEEKRGMALGMAAATMGLSNVLGAAVGSAIMGAFGIQNWPVMFYLCIPLCIAIMFMAVAFVPNDQAVAAEQARGHKLASASSAGTSDVAGSILFVLFVLLLLLGIRSIDFTNFAASITSAPTLACFASALVCALAFRFAEQKAQDPVFHLEYFHSKPIAVVMIASFFIGCFVISLVLVPEMAEYAMGAPLGSGGYYILAIGAASIIVTPLGGKAIDKIGPKPVLIIGFSVGIAGLLYLALIAVVAPSMPTLIAGLFVVGLGMGFAMGAPTNYMILENTNKADSAAAIATITLIRQIGTTVAPAILTGMIASAPGLAGYQNMLLCVAVFNLCALVTVLFYHSPKK